MLSAALVQEYAAKDHMAVLAQTNNVQDLANAFLAYLATDKKESALHVLRRLVEQTNLSLMSEAIDKALGEAKLNINQHMLMGQLLKNALPFMSPPLGDVDEALANVDFTYVMGTSNARGFGSSPDFFSIFTHIGHEAFLLHDDKYEKTLSRAKLIVKRMAADKPVLIILGAEPRLLLDNRFAMREQAFGELLESDYAHMDDAAKKYKAFGLALQSAAKGALNFLVPLPTLSVETNALTRYMIKKLYEEFEGTELGIIDPFEGFIDQGTGLMDEALQIVKDEEELHFNHDGLSIIMRKLIEKNMLPARALTGSHYQWDAQILIRLDDNQFVRIWNDPAKSLKSDMTAATVMSESLINYLMGHYARNLPETLMIVNAKQGFLPFNFPAGIAQNIISLSFDETDIEMCKRLYAFGGRKDIVPVNKECWTDKTPNLKGGDLIVNIYPNDDLEDVRALANEIIKLKQPSGIAVFSTSRHPDIKLDTKNYKEIISVDFGRRHIAKDWQSCKMAYYKLEA